MNNTANVVNDLDAQFQVVSYKGRLWIITALRNDIRASQEQGGYDDVDAVSAGQYAHQYNAQFSSWATPQ